MVEQNARNAESERGASARLASIQRRGLLLAGLTHDLRGPLTVIKIEARLLRRGLEAQYLDSVDNIERAARRMTSLIGGVDFLMHEPGLLPALTDDLRDPLTTTRIEAESLRRSISSSYFLEGVDAITRAVRRMTSWINDVVDAASAQNGQDPPLVLVPADLVQLIRDTIDEYHNARRHRLLLEARAPSIPARFDASRMERAIDNLVGNAIKYSPAGGDIQLEAVSGRRLGESRH